jgi:muramidase (phage lysozyme)
MRDRQELRDALLVGNVKAFLRAIRLGEGTKDDLGYHRLVGGEMVYDLSHHPRKLVDVDKDGPGDGDGDGTADSTAFGAYQINWRTEKDLLAKWGFTDFSPEQQDERAVALIIREGALDDVIAGNVRQAIALCASCWASLPGSQYPQRHEKVDSVLAEYKKHGGDVAT